MTALEKVIYGYHQEDSIEYLVFPLVRAFTIHFQGSGGGWG